MKLVGYPMKAKIEFFSNFCPEKCRGGLSMDDFYSYANRNDCTYFLRLFRTNFLKPTFRQCPTTVEFAALLTPRPLARW